eukprot:maker-scaffold_16-snap-gene-0.40-mRNA-1 protein AED:0.01 eAED:0.01 QI:132/1/1/1/0.5/0.33/3/186/512
MGTYLGTPIKEKHTESGAFHLNSTSKQNIKEKLHFVLSSMQGWRKTMEDAHIADCNLEEKCKDLPPGTCLFAVFDGHAGNEVSEFCAAHFVENLTELESFKARAYREALVECFHKMDDLLDDPKYEAELAQLRSKNEEGPNRQRSSLLSGGNFASGNPPPLPPRNSDEVVGYTEDSDSEYSLERVGYDAEDEDGVPGVKVDLHFEERHESLNLKLYENGLKEEDTEKVEVVEEVSIQEGGQDEEAMIELPQTVQEKVKSAEQKGVMSKNDAVQVIMELLSLKNAGFGSMGDGDTNEPVWREDPNSPRGRYTTAGCTALVALIVDGKLYVANAGDSRGVLCSDGLALALSYDHKPTQDREKTRIINAGGFVTQFGRVCGNLNLSRCIGDLKYKTNVELTRDKQIITAEPDVEVRELTEKDCFMVLACDGIYDVMTNADVVSFVKNKLLGLTKEEVATIESGESAPFLKLVVEDMFEHCITEDPNMNQGLGGDNMTSIIVFLKPLREIINILST